MQAHTLTLAVCYAMSLVARLKFEEAKELLRKTTPVARRFLGESHELTLRMRSLYAKALYYDEGATLDDIREAVTKLEDAERIARRVLGRAHPDAVAIKEQLRLTREALRFREE